MFQACPLGPFICLILTRYQQNGSPFWPLPQCRTAFMALTALKRVAAFAGRPLPQSLYFTLFCLSSGSCSPFPFPLSKFECFCLIPLLSAVVRINSDLRYFYLRDLRLTITGRYPCFKNVFRVHL